MEKEVIDMNSKTYKGDLVGILPLGVDAKHQFTPKYYEVLEDKYKPKFIITPLTMDLKRSWERIQRKIYLEELSRLSGNNIDTSFDDSDEYELREIMRKSFKGWENFVTAKGDSILYEVDNEGFLTKELFGLLHNEIIGDLTDELGVISCLTKSEKLGLD